MSNPLPEQIIEIALAHHQAGRLPEAERLYRSVLDLDPKNADALHYLGVMAGQIGRHDDAISYLTQAREVQPANANIYVNLAMTYLQMQQPDRAEEAVREALRLQPQWVEVINILGNCQFKQGKFAEAIEAFQHVLAMQPEHLVALSNLGAVYKEMGNFAAAVDCCRQILARAPDAPQAHNILAIALAEMGDFDQAMQTARRAIEIQPGFSEGWNTLGQILHQRGRLSDEMAAYQRAIASNVQEPAYQANLAKALLQQGRVEESIQIHQRIMELAPNNAQLESNYLFALNCSDAHSARDIYEAHLAWARRHADPLPKFTEYENTRDAHRVIRVGYVSADFARHPVGTFIEPVLAHHDRDQFEIYCYSSVVRPDEVTARLRQHDVRWREVAALSDAHLCTVLRQDQIDILVDLSGHTAGNRLLAFARRPAPIQLTWLGYPATTGLSDIDCRLTDAKADPQRMTERYCAEMLLRLPETFLCYRAPADAPQVAPTPALSRASITFGNFANLAKINDTTIGLWAKVLQCIPASRLILKSLGLGDEAIQRQFASRFSFHAISPDRVEYRPQDANVVDHLASFADVDVMLDTFPYAGTTSTCEALYMGVPVITLAGEEHRSRVGLSILQTVGLSEWVAQDREEFSAIARRVTADPGKLNQFRRGLRAQMQRSPVMDEKQFVAALEQTYRELFERWCQIK